MSQWDKLLKRIYSLDSNMRFDEICKILKHYGYTMRRPAGGSSHCTFRKDGCSPITIPSHEPIKTSYILLVRDIIEMEAKNDEEN